MFQKFVRQVVLLILTHLKFHLRSDRLRSLETIVAFPTANQSLDIQLSILGVQKDMVAVSTMIHPRLF